jgi:hypothetical protein
MAYDMITTERIREILAGHKVAGQPMMGALCFVTGRAVFNVEPEGLALVEVAKGSDVQGTSARHGGQHARADSVPAIQNRRPSARHGRHSILRSKPA